LRGRGPGHVEGVPKAVPRDIRQGGIQLNRGNVTKRRREKGKGGGERLQGVTSWAKWGKWHRGAVFMGGGGEGEKKKGEQTTYYILRLKVRVSGEEQSLERVRRAK